MKINKFFLFLFVGFLLESCSAVKNIKEYINPISPKYKSVPFLKKNIPSEPDYSLEENWAVTPTNYPKSLIEITNNIKSNKAAVFYIYPTLLLDPKDISWNADVKKNIFRDEVINKAVKYQASAWLGAGELYVPFYRQAHIRIFKSPFDKQGKEAWEIAYSDVKRSFNYFLKNYRNNRPIIIASHSQGTMHAKRLLKEFFDGTDLQNQLVAAYLVGAKITVDEFKHLKPLNSPNEFGGYVSWNTYKNKRFPKKYELWFKGGVTTNPINWNLNNQSSISDHLGLLYTDGTIYSKSVKIIRQDGILWASLPKVPKRFWLSFVKSYHFADINLFWMDIQKNAIDRLNNWISKNQ
ncbi:MAG: hypothetical protein CMC79_00045 [Flavobacteriaceae bacterium]|nr:hypothetical protein [Flavobacteriaceae bacterium]|tara:strand:+ start:6170 stop:7222 length:1053 start_codon:yes stop_codon:yes gene_type:complete